MFGEFYAPITNGAEMVRISKLEAIDNKTLLLFQMRNEFAREVYMHGRKNTSIRFHYVDVRTSPFLNSMSIGLVQQMLGGPSYYASLKRIYPTRITLQTAIVNVCFDTSTNKINKQYRKLPENQRKHVREFITRSSLSLCKKSWSFPTCVFWLTMLLMDCYAICRFLHYFELQPAGSTTVFFEGIAHSWTVAQFLMEWDAKKEFSTLPETFGKLYALAQEEKMDKCVRIG